MASFIAQQPNGLYCRYSTVVDCPTHWNFTKEEYLNNITGSVESKRYGQEVLDYYLQPFSEVIDRFSPNNMTVEEFEVIVGLMNGKLENE